MDIKFTVEETQWLANLLDKTRISPLAPDAIGFCERAQSIMSKTAQLTENNNGEQRTGVSDGAAESAGING